jgi:predicted GIY-YIG superfamily endonuclease
VFNSTNTLRSQLVRFKPKSDNVLNKNVVYSIPCECNKQYIGETGRAFDVRLKEHKNSIKKKDPDGSKLCENHYYTGHRIL